MPFTVTLFDGYGRWTISGKPIGFFWSWRLPCPRTVAHLEAVLAESQRQKHGLSDVAPQHTTRIRRNSCEKVETNVRTAKTSPGYRRLRHVGIPGSIDPQGRITYKHVGVHLEASSSPSSKKLKGIVSAQEKATTRRFDERDEPKHADGHIRPFGHLFDHDMPQPRPISTTKPWLRRHPSCAVVCQNLWLADSPSEMAQQVRAIVPAPAGIADEIKAFFVSKYGEWCDRNRRLPASAPGL